MVLENEITDGAILGMGNPLLDISANVPMELLEKYSVSLNNAILAEEQHMPLYKEMMDNFEVEYIAGGATQNSIRVAQWMTKTPGATAYVGCVGKDEYAQQLRQCALKDGVQVLYREDEETPTGTCAVLVNGGERSLVANLAAANKYHIDHFNTPEVQAAVNASRLVYIAGFFLTVSPDTICAVGRHCVENNKMMALNLSAPFIIDFFTDALNQALPFADFVFCNETEAQTLGKKFGWGNDGEDLREVALRLAASGKASGTHPRTVVFTQGAAATLVIQGGRVREFPVEPLPPALLVDTNGAGDAFVGGFLSQLVMNRSIEQCVRAGSFAARVVIQHPGCSFPEQCDFVVVEEEEAQQEEQQQ